MSGKNVEEGQKKTKAYYFLFFNLKIVYKNKF